MIDQIKPLASLAILLIFLTSSVQTTAQTLDEKEPLHWYADYDAARMEAMTKGKNVMLYFSGSDWCKPCIKLNREILETDTFAKFVSGNFVPVQLDFPKMKKNRLSKKITLENEALAEKYNPNGVFPLLVFLDQNEKMIGFTGYSELSPQAYVAVIDKILQQ
jgi:thioredoxin-related protein